MPPPGEPLRPAAVPAMPMIPDLKGPGGNATSSSTAAATLRSLQGTIAPAVVGSESLVRLLAIALASGGHVLLEGVPGLAKTYLVRSFASSLALDYKRIQFTPDMLPSDVIGAVVIDPHSRDFEFRPGPVFANVVLADEINRASPKVQSALLEAMQERQVTVEGRSYPLPLPFIVIATQNPIEQEGTYPLPEAELDRFLFRIVLGYPTAEDEFKILRTRSDAGDVLPERPVVSAADILRFQAEARSTFVHDDVLRYLGAIVRGTRSDPRVLFGGSPRSGVQFLNAAKAAALFAGRSFVVPDDAKELAYPALNHRLVLHPEALAQQIATGKGTTEELLRDIVNAALHSAEVPR